MSVHLFPVTTPGPLSRLRFNETMYRAITGSSVVLPPQYSLAMSTVSGSRLEPALYKFVIDYSL